MYAAKKAGTVFGENVLGPVPIHLDEVLCHGDEQNLGDCGKEKEHDCTHEQDAGVMCPGML